ncbi:MAG: hypothetical protein K5761_07570 [Clostridiales bacterium]|nr:hypothetical protein [Clostridiales bacterium]
MAYWTQHTHFLKSDEYECSNCGYVSNISYPFCPGCGSNMNDGNSYDPTWVDEAEMLDIIFDDDLF